MDPYSSAMHQTADAAINSSAIQMDHQDLTSEHQHHHLTSGSAAAAVTGSMQPHSMKYMNQRDKILMHQLNQYYHTKANARSKSITRTLQEVSKIVQDVLRELEIQEPRFISTFTEVNGHYDG